jgi:hypothetical protein
MATKVCQNFLYLMAKGDVDLDTNSLIWILMDTGFTFLQGSHHEYADISASELAAGAGYLQKTKAAVGIAITRNDTLYKVTITWTAPSWTATGGAIGPSPGAFLLDDTVANDPLIMYIDFGGEGTEPDGGTFTITSPMVELTTASA